MDGIEHPFLAQWRADTPGCQRVIHLNNAGAGLMPRPVMEAMVRHLELEEMAGGYEAEDLRQEAIAQTYRSIARLLGAQERHIALTSSATDAFNRALSAFPFQAGDSLVTTEQDYASNQIAFLSLQKRFGISIRRIGQRGGALDLDQLESAIREYRPRLVSITHIPTNSGLVQPAAEAGRICREHDVWFLLDACQSAGQMPLDVTELQCDFLSATARKFLRGPRGAGFLYVSDRAIEAGLEPLMIDMRGADWNDANDYHPREDARRFEDWEFSYALVLGTLAAVDYARAVGLETIQSRVRALAAYARERLAAIPGARILDQGAELGGIVTVHFPGQDPQHLKFSLREQGINTSISTLPYAVIDFTQKQAPWALRLSPHYYNSRDEIDTAIDKLMTLVP